MTKTKVREEFANEYNAETQTIFLSILIADNDLFAKCRTIIQDEYFDDRFRPAVRYILQHADKYRAIPSREMVEAKTGVELLPISPEQVAVQREWFCNDFEGFCRYRAMENVILDGVDLLREGQADVLSQRVKDALTIRLMSDLGTDYFDDPETRLHRLLDKSAKVSTGWPLLDEKLYGGFERGGLNIFLGNSGCVVAGTKVRVLYEDTQPQDVAIEDLAAVNHGAGQFLADSPDGWVPVEQWRNKGKKDTITITMETGTIITASDDHLFQRPDGGWLFAHELAVGTPLLCADGVHHVAEVAPAGKQVVYDLAIGHENHRYFTNGISSHNSGKSLVLQNLSLNWALAGFNVVYFSLELDEDHAALKMDAMLTGRSTREVVRQISDSALAIKMKSKKAGRLVVKRYPEGGTNVNDFRAYLKEFEIIHGVKPDAIIIDYLDLLHPIDRRIDVSNLFIKDKFVSEEIRALMHEMSAFGATASQMNRCVSPASEVYEKSRGMISVKDLKPGDQIMGSTGFVTVQDVFSATKKKAYAIKMKSGKTIVCSGNHRFPTAVGLRSIENGLNAGDKLRSVNTAL
jgi:hypothetical protein